MSLIAIDPGGVTGIAIYRAGNITHVEVPGAFDGFAEWAEKGIEWACTDMIVEKFTILPDTHKKDPVAIYETLDIIGATRLIARRRDIRRHMQTPRQAKNFAPDEVLKALGWHHPSPGGHANDAARHMVRFLASKRNAFVLETLAGMDE